MEKTLADKISEIVLREQVEILAHELQVAKLTPKPHLCPVCGGRTFVPSGFYSPLSLTSASDEPCRSYNAKGIVWS